MRSELIIRFNYGSIVPWVCHGAAVAAGERVPFVLAYTGSSEGPPERIDAEATSEATRAFWEKSHKRSRTCR